MHENGERLRDTTSFQAHFKGQISRGWKTRRDMTGAHTRHLGTHAKETYEGGRLHGTFRQERTQCLRPGVLTVHPNS